MGSLAEPESRTLGGGPVGEHVQGQRGGAPLHDQGARGGDRGDGGGAGQGEGQDDGADGGRRGDGPGPVAGAARPEGVEQRAEAGTASGPGGLRTAGAGQDLETVFGPRVERAVVEAGVVGGHRVGAAQQVEFVSHGRLPSGCRGGASRGRRPR